MTRIVIENARGTQRSALSALFDEAGYDVAVCGGPAAFTDGCCPLVSSGDCRLIDAADVVFFDLDLDVAANRDVLTHLRRVQREVPIVLEIPVATARRYHDLVDGCEVVFPFDADKLLAGVDRAVDQPPNPLRVVPAT